MKVIACGIAAADDGLSDRRSGRIAAPQFNRLISSAERTRDSQLNGIVQHGFRHYRSEDVSRTGRPCVERTGTLLRPKRNAS